jgi:nitrate reductase assembly molybdenum cofactor insertion protein NarJ
MTNRSFEHYDQLANLFYYPGPKFPHIVEKVQSFLDERYPGAGAEFKPFFTFVSQASQHELEELFTRSFEVQAATTLDLGYVLFGDDYKRGAVLVNLNKEHRQAGNDCGSELADHLPNVLRLLYKMQNSELRTELVDKIIAPALRKIIHEFGPKKLEKKNAVYKKQHKTLIEQSEQYGSIYQFPLKAVYHVLQADFEITQIETKVESNDFINSVESEMKLEPESQYPRKEI